MKESIFLSLGLLHVPAAVKSTELQIKDLQSPFLATFLTNLLNYGYVANVELLKALSTLSENELVKLWDNYSKALSSLYGTDRKMENFVVYKNFPKEVLSMDETTYWIKQILMYWGFDNDLFTEEELQRPSIKENVKTKVLQLSETDDLSFAFDRLKSQTSRWNDLQQEHALYLLENIEGSSVELSDFSFKENGILLIDRVISLGLEIKYSITTATDVLRLAAIMSNGDVSLRNKFNFIKFKRSERRLFLSLIDSTNNIAEDFAMRRGLWKRFLSHLHPNDFKFQNVSKAYDDLYNHRTKTFNSKLENLLNNKDKEVLSLLETRAGVFSRRLHETYSIFGREAFASFIKTAQNLNVNQLLKLKKYLNTINERTTLLIAPKANWTKSQIVKNEKTKILQEDLDFFNSNIKVILKEKVSRTVNFVSLDQQLKDVNLQTNDQKLASYGRGTIFDFPENAKFIRTASYWQTTGRYGNTFFDNGWNFFDENFKSTGACCWNSVTYGDKSAIFSGDPTNSKDLKGRACQMIDLYIDKLIEKGVRYAVWNILSYSHILFDDANDVFATLQFGENPEEGKLYEPKRAQFSFPVTGQSLTKYIAMLDLVERKVIYMDVNLPSVTGSAVGNGSILEKYIPSYNEYLSSLPNVYDIFEVLEKGDTPILYSDKNKDYDSEIGYVFNKENRKNNIKNIDLELILKL